MTALLRLDEVTLRRGGRVLVDDFNLTLGAGEAAVLIGPNGSGKSSLIRLAAGLLGAERGTVTRSDVALADDRSALDRELPLLTALSFWGGSVGEAMDALALTPLADVPVRLLSAGQLKRAALARVFASGAPLWLLDEPLNGLDADSVARLDAIIARHRSASGAVLAASHSPLAGDWITRELGA